MLCLQRHLLDPNTIFDLTVVGAAVERHPDPGSYLDKPDLRARLGYLAGTPSSRPFDARCGVDCPIASVPAFAYGGQRERGGHSDEA